MVLESIASTIVGYIVGRYGTKAVKETVVSTAEAFNSYKLTNKKSKKFVTQTPVLAGNINFVIEDEEKPAELVNETLLNDSENQSQEELPTEIKLIEVIEIEDELISLKEKYDEEIKERQTLLQSMTSIKERDPIKQSEGLFALEKSHDKIMKELEGKVNENSLPDLGDKLLDIKNKTISIVNNANNSLNRYYALTRIMNNNDSIKFIHDMVNKKLFNDKVNTVLKNAIKHIESIESLINETTDSQKYCELKEELVEFQNEIIEYAKDNIDVDESSKKILDDYIEEYNKYVDIAKKIAEKLDRLECSNDNSRFMHDILWRDPGYIEKGNYDIIGGIFDELRVINNTTPLIIKYYNNIIKPIGQNKKHSEIIVGYRTVEHQEVILENKPIFEDSLIPNFIDGIQYGDKILRTTYLGRSGLVSLDSLSDKTNEYRKIMLYKKINEKRLPLKQYKKVRHEEEEKTVTIYEEEPIKKFIQGDIVLILDTSGSLNNIQEIMKSICYLVVKLAMEQDRNVYVLNWSGHVRVFEPTKNIKELTDCLQYWQGGGNDTEDLTKSIFETFNNMSLKNSDVLMISDMNFNFDSSDYRRLLKLKEKENINFHLILTLADFKPSNLDLFDAIHWTDEFSNNLVISEDDIVKSKTIAGLDKIKNYNTGNLTEHINELKRFQYKKFNMKDPEGSLLPM